MMDESGRRMTEQELQESLDTLYDGDMIRRRRVIANAVLETQALKDKLIQFTENAEENGLSTEQCARITNAVHELQYAIIARSKPAKELLDFILKDLLQDSEFRFRGNYHYDSYFKWQQGLCDRILYDIGFLVFVEDIEQSLSRLREEAAREARKKHASGQDE